MGKSGVSFTKNGVTGEKRGRPSDDYVIAAMKDIYTFLDQGIDCHYSILKSSLGCIGFILAGSGLKEAPACTVCLG